MNLDTLLQNPAILSEVTNTLKKNPQLALQVLRAAAPELIIQFERIKEAIGKGTTVEQQLFISAHMHNFSGFLDSKAGVLAINEVLELWQNQVLPKKPEPVATT